MSGMAGLRATLYNVLMRRNSVYVTTCVVSSYALTKAYLTGTDSVWAWVNKGVSKLHSPCIVHDKETTLLSDI